MRLPMVSAVTVAVLSAAPAVAAPEVVGRFEMSRVSNGILRLDTATGALSICRQAEEEWACKPVTDPQLNLQHEVERLRKENDGLRTALERAEADPEPAPPETTDKKQDRLVPEAEPAPPANETIDEMVAVLEQMMRRFRDMIESLQQKQKDERQL